MTSSAQTKPNLIRSILAWGVHLFTATGAIWGLLGIFAIFENDYKMMIVWMIVAMLVDGFDGMLARWADVKKYANGIDGALLDNILDYLNYVVVPAIFMIHTDLLPERLGIRICFATWAFHANALLGGGERMIQIGIRASARDRGHWERELEVRQIWANEAIELGAEVLAKRVVEHLHFRGIRRVYVSNDIDGTDAHWAAACGTPEPGGLTPAMVVAVIQAVGREFELIGADLVELAPGLSLDREASARSIETAALYTRESLAVLAAGKLQE